MATRKNFQEKKCSEIWESQQRMFGDWVALQDLQGMSRQRRGEGLPGQRGLTPRLGGTGKNRKGAGYICIQIGIHISFKNFFSFFPHFTLFNPFLLLPPPPYYLISSLILHFFKNRLGKYCILKPLLPAKLCSQVL